MYQLKYFKENDITIIKKIIEQFDFATLIISINNIPEISHIPIMMNENNTSLYGHIAIANPMSKIIDSNDTIYATVIFQGNHGYISNNFYNNPDDNVPTWNYVAIHISGKISLIKDKINISSILDSQFAKYESTNINWDNPKISKLLSGIYGIKIDIESINAKFKLSQNKNIEDQTSIINNLRRNNNVELADFMQEYLNLDN
ncbi:MAG: FMN-binding negative transcriptional regulator [Burkholderiales bacterium]|nr:FMN-binding negative transcriptional regulator [Burkholderiales bacterium]